MTSSEHYLGTWLSTVCGDAWFSSCDSVLQTALLAQARARQLDSGEALYRQGDLPTHALFCVLRGAVSVENAEADGAASLLVYLEPGHWFGDACLIDGLARHHDAFADGPTTVLTLELQPFLDWLNEHPKYWQDIARLSVAKLRVTYQVVAERGSLHRRLARRLWLMAHGFGSRPKSPSIDLSVSQEQLAYMMGSSRQSINAALHELELEGFIAQRYREVGIIDLPGLLLHANGVKS